MATISRVTTWSDGQTLTASALNGEFNNIVNDYNGNITNANISASAAIALTKLASTPATLTGSETFTNKTLTKPIINGSVQGSSSYTPSGGGTATLDLSAANRHIITMPAGNITIAVSNGTTGQLFLVEIVQDSGGSRTVTWFTTIKWAGGSAPTLTTTASKKDTVGFVITGSNTYDGYIVGQNV